MTQFEDTNEWQVKCDVNPWAVLYQNTAAYFQRSAEQSRFRRSLYKWTRETRHAQGIAKMKNLCEKALPP